MTKESIDIRDLVHWALVDQQVEAAVAAANRAIGLAPTGTRDGTLTIERQGQLGTKIDMSMRLDSQVISHCHDDAVDVFEAIWALRGKARDLVYFHGKKKTAPDWAPEGVGERKPILNAGGQPMRDPDVIVNGKVIKQGRRYYTYVGNSPAMVERCRAEYTVWWEALSALARELEKKLSAHTPCPPGVSIAPWEVQQQKVGSRGLTR
jgi:hypothetical protein